MSSPVVLPLMEWARKLRYPTLFKITAGLFLLSLVVPDPLPFVDEILFGLGTLLLANWKRRRRPGGVDDAVPATAPRKP
ncbi:DUF6116 family protein [Stenotrophomonas mori]|uniref:Transmembrane protein n=1 Tax=Stenotrophomonas mori TaxID=2871096 RepID=A0ABT0SER4_9GAMM|nr:DUF6116 family protein [Stenotrophomonas mori]MCL7713808.1 hypothetical protein [Stenotrophomonas mori]